jgi:hypothetical protein
MIPAPRPAADSPVAEWTTDLLRPVDDFAALGEPSVDDAPESVGPLVAAHAVRYLHAAQYRDDAETLRRRLHRQGVELAVVLALVEQIQRVPNLPPAVRQLIAAFRGEQPAPDRYDGPVKPGTVFEHRRTGQRYRIEHPRMCDGRPGFDAFDEDGERLRSWMPEETLRTQYKPIDPAHLADEAGDGS